MGYGKKLIEYSFEQGAALGYDVIVIFGNPENYVSRGFKSCRRYHVSLEDGKYPAGMLVKELRPHTLDRRRWFYRGSAVMSFSPEEAERYDSALEKMEKKYLPSQEEFYIISHSFIEG